VRGFNDMSSSDRRRLQKQCRSILNDPNGNEWDLVQLCKLLRS
jgi:hypothetical protein